MKPVEQIINSLDTEPEKWSQGDYTLRHNEKGVEIWTSNMPYVNVGIYQPKRKVGFFDKIRLQLAVNRWHNKPLFIDKESN